jgi:hypothetical protein
MTTVLAAEEKIGGRRSVALMSLRESRKMEEWR